MRMKNDWHRINFSYCCVLKIFSRKMTHKKRKIHYTPFPATQYYFHHGNFWKFSRNFLFVIFSLSLFSLSSYGMKIERLTNGEEMIHRKELNNFLQEKSFLFPNPPRSIGLNKVFGRNKIFGKIQTGKIYRKYSSSFSGKCSRKIHAKRIFMER